MIDVVKRIARAEPALFSLLSEHIANYDEILPHVFMADVARFVSEIYEEGVASGAREGGKASGVLHMLDVEFSRGGNDVKELISNSFLENVDWESRCGRLIRGDLGKSLLRELDRRA